MVSLIRVQIVVKGMHTTTVDGTWGMVANFNWLYVRSHFLSRLVAQLCRLIEMWLGIICTCLPALHTFFRRRFGKHKSGHDIHLPAVRDPNSDRVDPNVVSDSGYESGELTGLSLGTLDIERQSNRRFGVRPMASDKSLLTTVTRSED